MQRNTNPKAAQRKPDSVLHHPVGSRFRCEANRAVRRDLMVVWRAVLTVEKLAVTNNAQKQNNGETKTDPNNNSTT